MNDLMIWETIAGRAQHTQPVKSMTRRIRYILCQSSTRQARGWRIGFGISDSQTGMGLRSLCWLEDAEEIGMEEPDAGIIRFGWRNARIRWFSTLKIKMAKGCRKNPGTEEYKWLIDCESTDVRNHCQTKLGVRFSAQHTQPVKPILREPGTLWDRILITLSIEHMPGWRMMNVIRILDSQTGIGLRLYWLEDAEEIGTDEYDRLDAFVDQAFQEPDAGSGMIQYVTSQDYTDEEVMHLSSRLIFTKYWNNIEKRTLTCCYHHHAAFMPIWYSTVESRKSQLVAGPARLARASSLLSKVRGKSLRFGTKLI